ncbi:MAG: heme-binding domain-containing protein [Bacteroidales bacterium]|nr:heme-binding domain-containing protein [Bacteroidales bacterium]
MKKIFNIILGIVIILAISIFVIAKSINTVPDSTLSIEEQAMAILSDGGCLACHSQTPQYPWYHSLPVISEMVEDNALEAARYYDIDSTYSQLKSPMGMSLPDLLRLKNVAEERSMPPHSYAMMHWESVITTEKAEILKQWLQEYRREHFPNGNAPEFAEEPIFVIPDVSPLPVDSAKMKLGEALYNDVRLSADNTISCASCHDLIEKYGTDNEQVSDGVNAAEGTINAPTVLNSVFNFVQFWDGRALTLATQAAAPPVNPVEMANESFDQIIAKLIEDKEFMKEFGKVYNEVTEATITDAIEHYERTLITPNGPFDRYLKGEQDAISADAIEGYAQFKGHDCADCHSGVIVGGRSYEYMGLSNDYFADRGPIIKPEIDDRGHFSVTNNPYDLHRFKVPGLRNVAYTWPYFHDGTRNTLEEAVKDMAWYQHGVVLTTDEIDKIVAFLKTL